MADPLKRIEEDYGTKPKRANADVILKLARALDDVRESSSGPMRRFCERVLNEVAGGSDG